MNKNTPTTKFHQEIFETQNLVRTNPKAFIPVLEKYIKYFQGNILVKPGSDTGIETVEGKAAYQECINFLKNQKPLKALKYDSEISKASQDHANDIGSTGSCDHVGSDGSSMDSRVERYVEWDVTISENIDFGAPTGEEVMISLLVDDGVKNRGHRKNIFNDKLAVCGIGTAKHTEYGICTVMDYVGGIISYKTSSSKTPKSETKSNNQSNGMPLFIPKTSSILESSNDKIKALQKAIVNRDKSSTVAYKADSNLKNDFKKKLNVKELIDENPFKDDPDAPEGAVACSIKTVSKKVGNKTTKKTIKTYTLDDGTQEIHEIEETESFK